MQVTMATTIFYAILLKLSINCWKLAIILEQAIRWIWVGLIPYQIFYISIQRFLNIHKNLIYKKNITKFLNFFCSFPTINIQLLLDKNIQLIEVSRSVWYMMLVKSDDRRILQEFSRSFDWKSRWFCRMKSTQEENTILTSSNMELQKIPSTVFNASVSYVTYKQTVFNDAEQNISDQVDKQKIQSSSVTT